jgi:hypothetical protein
MKNIYTICLMIVLSLVSVSSFAGDGDLSPNKSTLTASLKKGINNTVSIQWSAINESNIASYTIEKSTDGENFTFFQSVTPTNAEEGVTIYKSMKIKVTTLTSFRITITEKSGDVSFIYL